MKQHILQNSLYFLLQYTSSSYTEARLQCIYIFVVLFLLSNRFLFMPSICCLRDPFAVCKAPNPYRFVSVATIMG